MNKTNKIKDTSLIITFVSAINLIVCLTVITTKTMDDFSEI